MNEEQLKKLEELYPKGSKAHYIGTEIIQLGKEVTPERRKEFTEKYKVKRGYVSNIISQLRKASLYSDAYSRGEKTPPLSATSHGRQTNGDSHETSSGTSLGGGEGKSQEESQIKGGEGSDSHEAALSDVSEMRKELGFLRASVRELTGKLGGNPYATSPSEREPEPPQIMDYPRDILIKRIVWFVPKVLTLYQIYVEDSQKKELEPPNFAEWVNYMILETYRTRGMDLALVRPPRIIKSPFEREED